MINPDKFFEYLKEKIPNFLKTSKKGQVLFSCVNEKNHKYQSKTPTMTTIPGSDKFYCLQCAWKGNIYDCIRLLEEDKKNYSDAKILEYITNSMKIDSYPELDKYKEYGWSLQPVAKNGKIPLQKDWTNKTYYDKADWLKWIDGGINIGLRTGEVSKITVIDVDLKVSPSIEMEEIYKELTASKTLTQNSPHGKHFIFRYDKSIKSTTKILGLTIDIRNDGAQLVIFPSSIDNLNYNWVNLGDEIKELPENIKNKLLLDTKINEQNKNSEMPLEIEQIINNPIELKGNNLEGECNNTFVQFGGALVKMGLPAETIRPILFYLNKNWLKNPMTTSAVESMIHSLDNYKESEEQTQEKAVEDVCKLLQCDIGAKDIMEHTGLSRAIVDKYLAKFHKEGKLVRRGRGKYESKQRIEWTNEAQAQSKEYPYKVPYFDDIAHFYSGDIIIIGAPTGRGKTHVAMNILKQIRSQGIIPYYISLESGSRHEKIAHQLGLTPKDYYISKESITNPLQVELEENAFTVIDWLNLGEDFAATPAVFQHLSNEMKRKGGILVVFNQLRDDYRWFAPDLVKQFARLSARFVYDDQSGVISHFDCDKITDPKGHYLTANVPCEFSFDTKELKKKDII